MTGKPTEPTTPTTETIKLVYCGRTLGAEDNTLYTIYRPVLEDGKLGERMWYANKPRLTRFAIGSIVTVERAVSGTEASILTHTFKQVGMVEDAQRLGEWTMLDRAARTQADLIKHGKLQVQVADLMEPLRKAFNKTPFHLRRAFVANMLVELYK